MADVFSLILIIVLLVTTFFTGSIIENNHYKKIKKREIALYKFPCITYGNGFCENSKIKHAYLVTGTVVLGCDYFKTFLAGLINIFGGNISAYESVLDRGRREAILRMRELAYRNNAGAVINVRLETVMLNPIDSNSKAPQQVCVTAYGTAIHYDK